MRPSAASGLVFLLLHGVAVAFFNPAATSLRRAATTPTTALHLAQEKKDIVVIAENRKSSHEYEFTETYEAGIQLCGTEVKSCRKNMVQLSDAIAEIRDGECWLINCHISEYQRCGRLQQHKPQRVRKLLLHGKEILKLEQRVLQRNCEIIPTRIYFNEKNFVKLELGVGTKKNLIDKRDDVMKREGEREIRRSMKGGYD